MKHFLFSLFLLSITIFVGCSTDTNGIDNTQSQTEQEIQTVIDDSLDLYFDGLDDFSEDNFLSDEPNWLSSTSLNKVSETKVRFGRIKTKPVEHRIDIITDTDSTATAYLYVKFEGNFIAKKYQRDEDTTSISRYVKPLTHEIERIIHLKKRTNAEAARRNWRIVDISFADGQSPINTVQIEELTIMAVGIDTVTITDPLNYFMNGADMFILPRFTEVKLQVKVRNTTSNPVVFPENTESTESVRLQYGRNRLGNFARTNFDWISKDGDLNVYEGKWIVRQFRGLHHAIIDVINNGTIFEEDAETYPYVSNTWATPYRVTIF